ncbi:MAG: valine--tRNA ligase [Ruminococcus sp.]|uniref:valine--tRNA ligase n=1 Tax=Ruminococcus sp. TaxID=41978 RepID=UPI0025FB0121|nr:valine--tRNA ligase [Ruminococcus sp.]MCR5539950.1 valine--tRNA ligase [Ruminococcus sp.]
MKELSKTYDPREVESRTYKAWEEAGCFRGVADPKKKPYSIAMPPPNVTGQLHMGHAVDNTMQDILTRFKRMQGYAALWIPGTDHAAIATEAKIVEAMRQEGITKADLGRDKFMERAWAWKEKFGGRIVEQLRTLGTSCDWEREHFTMDDQCSKAVLEVFVKLYEEGLIYRGNRMVNWCPKCQTSISDAEVEYDNKDGNFWHILYKVKETGEFLEIATTRPETMLGDTAVAINEEDPRYKHLHGCHVILPLLDKEIPIVCDEHADMEKGTGVVKITPAHDPNDFEVGQRHNLPSVRCFTYDGHMTGAEDKAAYEELKASGLMAEGEPEVLDCGKYAGMTTVEARKVIVSDLEALGLLKEVEPLKHDVGTCYRCHSTIEPMISKQWFVKMKPLAEPAIKAVEEGKIKFVPERFTKTYLNWMNNTRDWCISRQLWWGHRIPAWYCADCGEINVAKEAPCKCKKCGSTNLTQDEDSLDTWFSSALWPFSILGWPDKQSDDFNYFYPTSTLVTGYDIIGFWVSRMIFSSLAYTGKAPFDTVLIHGIVRDSQGRKMSKSLGNGIDPLEVIDQYGADALRFMLVQGSSPGNDMRYSEEKIVAMRNFTNKIWNASRFLLMNMTIDKIELPKELTLEDKWILSSLNKVIKEVTYNLEHFEMGVAAQKVYDFIWNSFCDWYIELAKNRFNGEDAQAKKNVENVLAYVLTDILKMLHPFMPFITEEIYQALPHEEGYLMMQSWPEFKAELDFPADEARMEKIMEAVRAVRECRSGHNVPNSRKAHITIVTANTADYAEAADFLKRLASASEVTVTANEPADASGMVTVATADAKLLLPLRELVDIEAEKARITKELEKANKELDFVNSKLNNEKFMSKAPEKVVNEIREKEVKAKALVANLTEMLNNL